jgi:RimJ/RimL family protein N-acetyltransferase
MTASAGSAGSAVMSRAACSLDKAPERVETARLVLQRPRLADAEAIFRTYASDLEVTRYLGWPRHVSVEQTRAFLSFSDAEWSRWPAGPYLVFLADQTLIGSTGLAFEAPDCAVTGYVFAKSAWGRGYATEALHGMVDIAQACGARALYALCHVDHRPSAHVLEKCGFASEGIVRRYAEFPNLSPGVRSDVLKYSRALAPQTTSEGK